MVSNGKLLRFGQPVHAEKMGVALRQFFAGLKSLDVGPVLLISHNCFNFDFPVLIGQTKQAGLLDQLNDCVAGFADTLPAFRQHAKGKVKSFSIESLCKEFLSSSSTHHYSLHSADDNVAILARLLTEGHLRAHALLQHAKSIDLSMLQFTGGIQQKMAVDDLKSQLYLKDGNGISVSLMMIKKIASSDLTYKHLCLAYKRGGPDGLKAVLTEKAALGKPRVTKNKSVLNSIVAHFAN